MSPRLSDAIRRNGLAMSAVRRLYPALAWTTSRPAYYRRRAGALAELEFDEALFSDRGNELEAHIARTKRFAPLAGSDLLVLGVGRGEELDLWKRERPGSLTAMDYFRYEEEWSRHPEVTFLEGDIRSLPLPDAAYDVVVSKSVLEHVDGIEAATQEMHRVVRPTGVVFANFGPLYFAHGGAHYYGAYEHLWLADEEFDAYLTARDIAVELNEGRFYLRNKMFSRRTFAEYLDVFRTRFDPVHVILHVSSPGLRYRREHPEEWAALTRRYAERDLLANGMTVWLRPKSAGAAGGA